MRQSSKELLIGVVMIAVVFLILALFGGVPPELSGMRGR